jgi:regulator of protease activity HflC (stomatin/prohibitin superfamily)
MLGLIMVALLLVAIKSFVKFETDQRGNFTATPRFSAWSVVASIAFIGYTFVLWPAIGSIDAGECGVVTRFGAVTGRIIQPGIYWVKPFVESVEVMDCKIQADTANAEGASKDLQVIKAEVTVNYSLDSKRAAHVYETLRENAMQRVITPAIQEAVKSATANFTAEELITKRADAKTQIQNHLMERMAKHGFLLDTVNITDFDFTHQFNEAIEAKVTAQQQAEKAKHDLTRITTEAEQGLARATAEAKGLELQKSAITPELINLRMVEAFNKAVEKWDGKLPVTLMGLGGGTTGIMPIMPVEAAKK